MVRYSKVYLLIFTFVFLFCVNSVLAQKAGDLKIAYVDIGRLFDGYYKTDGYDKFLEEKYSKFELERKGRIEKIRDAEGKLSILNEDERNKQQAQIDKNKTDFLEFDRQQQTDLRKERDERIREILLEIENVVDAFAKKGGYSIILNDKVLIYGQKSLDITEEVLKELNKNKGK